MATQTFARPVSDDGGRARELRPAPALPSPAATTPSMSAPTANSSYPTAPPAR